MTYRQDTIAAIATAPGNGGIGIIRMSGPDAGRILSGIFVPAGQAENPPESHRMVYGRIADGEETVDECMAVFMRAPRSYTREDVAEIQIHGGSFVVNRVLELCLKQGARLAEAGEFTRRAFLNGRVDLSRAEAVMELINARGEQAHKAAVRQLSGGASSFIHVFSDKLADLQAGLAACIDYPEEISDEEGAGALKEGLENLVSRLESAIDEHASRLIHQGLQIALIGRPNVGKSSLLNALLGEERAIVTNIPGTTRDTVQGEMTVRGFRVTLTDTAGIHETDDPVEKIGVERSEKARKEADASLLILDGSEPMTDTDRELISRFSGKGAVVINKTDLPQVLREEDIRGILPDAECITVCANDPESLKPLVRYLEQFAEVSDQLALTQPRHLDAARRALAHMKDALKTLDSFTPDVAATDLQAAQAALGEITGEYADEKLLDRVFSHFCVGK
ncbi:MAG: tRNA uridine-5-carboxymethylaminomethyl(34) synthesis GTPase MnmE [Clostridiales bacterium]|nr:tRNA uridine-5-carboxymethylaminomethyl(34) synthesis GTPase MnmE [Clostridiales bacterium]